MEWLAYPAGAAGALAAVGWIVRKVYGWAKRLEAMIRVADYELKHNGGKSMKDAIHRIETRLGHIEEHLGIGDGK